jgi:uncharacterized protein YutD
MHTIEIPQKSITKYLRENLAECNEKEYVRMCRYIYEWSIGMTTYEQMRIKALYFLMEMKAKKQKKVDEEKEATIYQISSLIDSFFYSENENKGIKLDFMKVPIKSHLVKFTRIFGPADYMTDLTFGEYTDALRTFNDFNATQDNEMLFVLAAILYREKYFFKDERKPHDTTILDKQAQRIKKYADPGFVYGVYLTFASFQKELPSFKLPWGGQELDMGILFGGENTTSTETFASIGLDQVAFTMAESGAFGNLEQVKKANFWEVMVRMYDTQVTALRNKKQETR